MPPDSAQQSIVRPYHHAPRLPDGEQVDVRALVGGEVLELEVGPGRGWFLVERAKADPAVGLVGIEIRRKWASIVDARLTALGLRPRARVFAEDALSALARLGPEGSLQRVFVSFPDPWWKKRHFKRLLMRPVFIAEVARLLGVDGELFVQTDVEDRAQAYEGLVRLDGRFVPCGDADGSPRMGDNPYGVRSPRERRAIADALPVARLRWRRLPRGG